MFDSSRSNTLISVSKFFIKWKNCYYLFFNLFYYNLTILVFGNIFFRKELTALNWYLFTGITNI